MNTCATCIHWQHDETRYNNIVMPLDPATMEPSENEDEIAKRFGHRVRYCKCPKVLFYQRPDKDGSAVCDGSEYMAYLITGEGFGCVNHKTK